jgi:hypothetical protein
MAESALDELLLRGLTGRTPWKAECDACATTNVTRSGEQTVDGVALVAGDRVLLTAQTASKDNGIFTVSTGSWARAADFGGISTCRIGTTVLVARGTSNSGVYRMTSPTSGDVTPGVTSTTWTKVGEFADAAAAGGGAADLAPDYTEPADHADATLAYTDTTLAVTSSLDSGVSVTARIYYDNGVYAAASADMPVLYLFHAFAGTTADWATTELRRAAKKGFLVVCIAKRGDTSTPHSSGGADECRDVYETIDTIAAVASTYAAKIAPRQRYALGLSGGSAALLQTLSKVPGLFCAAVASQLGGDWGVNPAVDASYWGYLDSGAAEGELEARIGTRATSIAPYRARNANANLADSIRLSNTKLFLLWDAQDTIGVTMRATARALAVGGAPRTQWYAEESDTGDTLRWEHGYPATVTDLLSAFDALANVMRSSPDDASSAGVADYLVCGWMARLADSYGDGALEIWTAPSGTTNARDYSEGGKDHCVRVRHDAASGQVHIEPMSGSCAVTIIYQGVLTLTTEVVDHELWVDPGWSGVRTYAHRRGTIVDDATETSLADARDVAPIPVTAGTTARIEVTLIVEDVMTGESSGTTARSTTFACTARNAAGTVTLTDDPSPVAVATLGGAAVTAGFTVNGEGVDVWVACAADAGDAHAIRAEAYVETFTLLGA